MMARPLNATTSSSTVPVTRMSPLAAITGPSTRPAMSTSPSMMTTASLAVRPSGTVTRPVITTVGPSSSGSASPWAAAGVAAPSTSATSTRRNHHAREPPVLIPPLPSVRHDGDGAIMHPSGDRPPATSS
jgi:hypothetical protein